MLRPYPRRSKPGNGGVAAAPFRPSLRPYSPNGRPPAITKGVWHTRAHHELYGSENARRRKLGLFRRVVLRAHLAHERAGGEERDHVDDDRLDVPVVVERRADAG